MKHLTVTIRAELEVPDNWQLVEHASGMVVLKAGMEFVDFDLAPLTTNIDSPEAEWSDRNDALVDQVLDAIIGVDVELELQQTH